MLFYCRVFVDDNTPCINQSAMGISCLELTLSKEVTSQHMGLVGGRTDVASRPAAR